MYDEIRNGADMRLWWMVDWPNVRRSLSDSSAFGDVTAVGPLCPARPAFGRWAQWADGQAARGESARGGRIWSFLLLDPTLDEVVRCSSV